MLPSWEDIQNGNIPRVINCNCNEDHQCQNLTIPQQHQYTRFRNNKFNDNIFKECILYKHSINPCKSKRETNSAKQISNPNPMLIFNERHNSSSSPSIPSGNNKRAAGFIGPRNHSFSWHSGNNLYAISRFLICYQLL